MSGIELASGVTVDDGHCITTNKVTLKTWQFTYDGDGSRVKQVYTEGTSTLTTYYYGGGSYEVQTDGTTETVTQYYSIAGMTVAMRVGAYDDTPEEWSFFLTDHLGSVVGVTNNAGTLISEARYTPLGELRDLGEDVDPITQTDFGYTFQRVVTGSGLMDYRARMYDPWLGRFVQPDTIIPGAGNPQAYNRYGYVLNSPINANDPTGHMPTGECGYHGEDCSVSTDALLDEYGVTADVSKERLPSVLKAIFDVSYAICKSQGSLSNCANTFKKTFSSSIHFQDSQDVSTLGWGETVGNNITLYAGTYRYNGIYWNNFLVHEMGHAFDNTVGLKMTSGYQNRLDLVIIDGWTKMPTGNDGYASSTYPWIQGNHNVALYEETADMFLGWTYNSWGVDKRRANWMNLWMPYLINDTTPSYNEQYNFDEETGISLY